jgi:hypothetical protein
MDPAGITISSFADGEAEERVGRTFKSLLRGRRRERSEWSESFRSG